MISVSKIHNFATSTPVSFENPEDLANFIIDNDWAHSIFNNNWRDKKNFLKTDLLVLDIDNGETKTCSLEQAVSVFADYRHIIATSRNHNKSKAGEVKDRYRVILFLDKTITKGEDYSKTWKEAQNQWPFIDPSCCDESRFWYKSTEIISYNFGETAKLIPVVETEQWINVVNYSKEVVEGARGIDAVDWSKCPKYMPKCIYLLTKGVAQPGERSRTFFILSRYYRNQGYGKETTYYLLKSISKLNQELYPEVEPISKDEIWNQHCSAAYNERGIDEMHVGTTGTSFEDELLNKYCSLANNGKPCLLHNKKQEKKEIIKISDIADSFNTFAKAIDQNTIRTGIDFIDENVRILVGTPTLIVGSTGCHRKGQEILMYNGSIKKVEDIIVGDKLMGSDSTPRKVLELKRGVDSMYMVAPTKGIPFYVNSEHVLHLFNYSNGIQNITVKEFEQKSNHYKHCSKLVRTGVKFKSKKVPIDPYFLGLWLGDGNSDSLSISTKDFEIVDYLQIIATQHGLKIHNRVKNSEKCPNYSISSDNKDNRLWNSFKSLGLKNNKHIPTIYKINSRDVRLKILAGLLDTDGSLHCNGFDFIQKNKTISEDVVFISRSLGLAAYIKECKKADQHGTVGTYYRVSISGNTDEIPTLIKRKQATERQQIKNVLRTGFRLQKIADQEEYFGFTVDKDNLYLLNDFTVTHNSGKTTFTLNAIEHNNKLGLNTVFFSLDMNRNMIYIKLAQKLTNYTQDQILDFYRSNNTTKIGEIKEIISSVYNKTYFDFTTAQTFVEVEQRIMDTEQRVGEKIKLVAIDYADRLIGAYQDEYNNSRFNALKSVEVADNTQTALMIISQISRQNGDVSTPLLSKRISRGSGAWEESSRVQLNIWREMYGQPEDDWIMNVFLAKNTLGKEIPGSLFWDGAKSVIRDMTAEEADHYETNVKPMVEAKKSHSKFSI